MTRLPGASNMGRRRWMINRRRVPVSDNPRQSPSLPAPSSFTATPLYVLDSPTDTDSQFGGNLDDNQRVSSGLPAHDQMFGNLAYLGGPLGGENVMLGELGSIFNEDDISGFDDGTHIPASPDFGNDQAHRANNVTLTASPLDPQPYLFPSTPESAPRNINVPFVSQDFTGAGTDTGSLADLSLEALLQSLPSCPSSAPSNHSPSPHPASASPLQRVVRTRTITPSFFCPLAECISKGFTRKADLERHLRNGHRQAKTSSRRSSQLQMHWYCDYESCRSRQSINRLDHFRDHLRSAHKEDIVRRNATATDAAQDHAYNISPDWWRCAKCMSRVYILTSGWECPKDQIKCHDQVRRRIEMVIATTANAILANAMLTNSLIANSLMANSTMANATTADSATAASATADSAMFDTSLDGDWWKSWGGDEA